MRISLFWRTLLLIGGLMVLSLAATLKLAREFEHAPPEQQLAWEIASIVNLTRSALVSSEGPRRSVLLDELARVEDVRVLPLEPGDSSEPLPSLDDTVRLERSLRAMLGAETRIAGSVNGEPGLWVSFDIDDDGYWLVMGLERWTRRFGPPWWLVASIAIAISLAGAIAISRLVNRPLAQLAGAIGRVSQGGPAPRLPEHGPTEIATLNQHFNRMAADLAALEADRTVALAGISHDIRTPLTRLRMEVELSALDDGEKASMSEDIERIDQIVGKFVEYARTSAGTDRASAAAVEVDAAGIVGGTLQRHRAAAALQGATLEARLTSPLAWRGDPVDLARIVSNLVENALRHGRSESEPARVELSAERAGDALAITVRDRGPGVPETEIARLLRPFARLDDARGERGGSGLGLAIVDRLARRYGGECGVTNRVGGGLEVRVRLPDAR